MTLLIALIIGFVVAVPWAIAGRFVGAAVSATVACILSLIIVYFGLLTTAGPLFGAIGWLAAWLLLISGFCSLAGDDGRNRSADTPLRFAPTFVGCAVFLVFVVTEIFSSAMFRARDYAALVPPIKQSEWSGDFQPKDPRHFRVSSAENAHFLAGRAIGQATTVSGSGVPNAIGSQFTIHEDRSSLQIIKGELWTIVPLDWTGPGPQWSGTPGVPGYIKVSAENPIIPAQYVPLPRGKEFRYTPESIWGQNLQRYVWSHHMDKYIADIHLEIDDDGNPHYIVSMSEPRIAWGGDKVIGALIIDPVTGDGVDEILPLGKIPAWVDRVESMEIVHRNIDYHSKYANGFINRSIYGTSVLMATETHFGYGSDGQPVFATGITAENNNTKASSLVAMYYTNTRTGETTEYMLQGGATEEKAVEQVDLIGQVKNQSYHGTTPQLYNVYGHISYVVPLVNQTHAFAGVAIVDVMNPQIIAWGPNAYDAELAYKQVIISDSSQMAIDGTRKMSSVTATVKRINSATVSGMTTYFVWLNGMDHLLTIPMTASPKIAITQPGDTIRVEYYDSGEALLPVSTFDNVTVQLTRSAIEKDVQTRAGSHIAVAQARENEKSDIQQIMLKLTPEQQQLLNNKLRDK